MPRTRTARQPVARAALAAALAVVPISGPAAACPAYLEAGSLAPLPAAPRRDLRLFSIGTVGGRRVWESRAVQVDPLDDAGVLVIPKAGEKLESGPLAPADRVSFRVESFGERTGQGDGLPCKTPRIHEIEDVSAPGRYAYLAACDDPSGATLSPGLRPVTHDRPKRRIASPLFEYVYLPNNQLIFDEFAVRDPATGATQKAGRGADILLHLDVKKFFTMEFTNDNVNSFVEALNTGDVGMVARIQFYLRLLFFKIDLKMATLASWFSDSANIPMMIDVPAEGPDRLHAGSGMLFNWAPEGATIKADDPYSTTPRADPARIAKGAVEQGRLGLANCEGDVCRFRLLGAIGDRRFTIDMTATRFLVQHGFFPSWVQDLGAFKKGMGWSEGDEPEDKGRVAMYFETSGLPKGQYRMDYWIRMVEPGQALASCPRAVKATRAIDAKVQLQAH